MLSSFYWGYSLGQIPAVLLTKYIPARHLFAISILMASLFTILMPIAVQQSYYWGLLVRAATGIAESAAFPCVFQLYNYWVPNSEKTIMITLVMSGVYLVSTKIVSHVIIINLSYGVCHQGEILCFVMSGYLAETSILLAGVEIGSWRAMFWMFGCIGILWSPIWLYIVPESPESGDLLPQELDLLMKGRSFVY